MGSWSVSLRRWVLVLICALVLKSYLHQRRISKKFLDLYGVKSSYKIPIFGHVLRSLASGGMNNAVNTSRALHETHGGVLVFWFFDTPMLKIADPNVLKVVLGSKASVNNHFLFGIDKLLIVCVFGSIWCMTEASWSRGCLTSCWEED